MRHLHTRLSFVLLVLLALTAPLRAEDRHLLYQEVVTGDADPADALPMVVAIHGLGGSPETFKGLFTAWTVPVRVILPQGPASHGRGWSWFETVIRDGDVVKISEDDIISSAERIATLIEHLVATRPTVGKPIITGFSQGGVLSFVVAVRSPEHISMAIPMGGWLPEALQPKGPVPPAAPPLRVLHGEADTLVPFSRTKEVVDALAARGWAATLSPYPGMKHSVGRAMRSDLLYYVKGAVLDARNKKVK